MRTFFSTVNYLAVNFTEHFVVKYLNSNEFFLVFNFVYLGTEDNRFMIWDWKF